MSAILDATGRPFTSRGLITPCPKCGRFPRHRSAPSARTSREYRRLVPFWRMGLPAFNGSRLTRGGKRVTRGGKRMTVASGQAASCECCGETYKLARKCLDNSLTTIGMLSSLVGSIGFFRYNGVCYKFTGDTGTPVTIITPADVHEFDSCAACDDCACDTPVATVTITISGMVGGGATYNGTYPNVPNEAPSGALCGWRYDWEAQDPLPSVEIVIAFTFSKGGSTSVRATKPGGQEVFLDVHPDDETEFCDGDPIVFTVNGAVDHPEYGGTITVTADP